jgi:hypothetical protein
VHGLWTEKLRPQRACNLCVALAGEAPGDNLQTPPAHHLEALERQASAIQLRLRRAWHEFCESKKHIRRLMDEVAAARARQLGS